MCFVDGTPLRYLFDMDMNPVLSGAYSYVAARSPSPVHRVFLFLFCSCSALRPPSAEAQNQHRHSTHSTGTSKGTRLKDCSLESRVEVSYLQK